MVEMDEILDGRLGKCSVKQVRYVINNLLYLVIVKYGVISLVLCISTSLRFMTILLLLVKYGIISLVLCISTRLRFMTILSLLVKYLHADPRNKSYIILYFPTICNHSYGGNTQVRSFVKGEGDEFSYGKGKRQRRPCHLWDMLRVIMTSAIAKKENSVMQV